MFCFTSNKSGVVVCLYNVFTRRDVDLCPKLTALLKAFVGNRTSRFLFQNRNGNFLSHTNLLRRGLHPALEKLKQPKAGFHAFRRYRLTWLRRNRGHADLERFWMGHENETVGDGYSKMKEDVAFRLEQAEAGGLGFAFPKKTPMLSVLSVNTNQHRKLKTQCELLKREGK